MTATEFEVLVRGIRNAYPNSDFLASTDGKKMWYQFLKDVDYKTAGKSAVDHIKTNKFPPSIAEIRSGIHRNDKFNNFLPRGYDIDKLEIELLEVDMKKCGNGIEEKE